MGGNKQEEVSESEEILKDPEVFEDLNSVIEVSSEDFIINTPNAHPEPKPTK